jgi:transcriptional regulator with XRE-family HTH domain
MPKLDLAALAYLRHVLLQTKLSPSALAKKAGLASTTLTRALNDPDHKFALTTTTLQKIAEASGINPAPFLQAEDVAELSMAPILRPERIYEDRRWGTKFFGAPNVTPVVGEIAAGKWIEPEVYPPAKNGFIDLVASPPATASDCFCVVVADDSFDVYARPGDFLFCYRAEGPPVSDLVVVERRDAKNFKIELTARHIKKRLSGGWILEPSVTHGQPFEAVELDSLEGTPKLKIIGYVRWILRDPPWTPF